MGISDSVILHNAASSLGYSAVTLRDRVQAVMNNTVFNNNSALSGGAMFAKEQCRLSLTNCTFSSNKAMTGKVLNLQNSSWIRNDTGTFKTASLTLFNQASLHNKKPKIITAPHAHLLKRRSINKKYVKQEKTPHGLGGAIYVDQQSYLLVRNCFLKDNSAHVAAGAIVAGRNGTLDIQQTTFAGNKASGQGGAIDVEHTKLRITNCVFDDNVSLGAGGAISGVDGVKVAIQETHFTGNTADEGGAIVVSNVSHLQIRDCTFKDNHAKQMGGAISGGLPDTIIEINRSYFFNNSGREGGTINVQLQTMLFLTNCRLECNFASESAGAITAAYNATLTIRETNFTGNSAPTGGALSVRVQSECKVDRCVFHNNTVQIAGGAVVFGLKSSLKIENTNFTNNNSSDGGAIFGDTNSYLQTNSCSFLKNVAKQDGGAISLNGVSTAEIESCRFLSNQAITGQGGAMALSHTEHVAVKGTLLLGNVASANGGAIANYGTNFTMNNITCVGNRSPRRWRLPVHSIHDINTRKQ